MPPRARGSAQAGVAAEGQHKLSTRGLGLGPTPRETRTLKASGNTALLRGRPEKGASDSVNNCKNVLCATSERDMTDGVRDGDPRPLPTRSRRNNPGPGRASRTRSPLRDWGAGSGSGGGGEREGRHARPRPNGLTPADLIARRPTRFQLAAPAPRGKVCKRLRPRPGNSQRRLPSPLAQRARAASLLADATDPQPIHGRSEDAAPENPGRRRK